MATPIDALDLNHLSDHGEKYIVFFHTPLCGTCKLARRMLDVVEATRPGMTMFTCDANFAGGIIQTWEIRSVPALAYVDHGRLIRVQFAFPGVSELFQEIQAFFG